MELSYVFVLSERKALAAICVEAEEGGYVRGAAAISAGWFR